MRNQQIVIVFSLKTGNCAYGLLLMAVFWITEALPLAVTALLPIIVFPLLGVSKVNTLAAVYTNVSFVSSTFTRKLTSHVIERLAR